MKEYYELGKIAALNELVNSARKGNELAIKVASAIPAEYNNIPREVIEASVEYGEKVAADWNKIQEGAKKVWGSAKEEVTNIPSQVKALKENLTKKRKDSFGSAGSQKMYEQLNAKERNALLKSLGAKAAIGTTAVAAPTVAGAYALSGKKKTKKNK